MARDDVWAVLTWNLNKAILQYLLTLVGKKLNWDQLRQNSELVMTS